MNLEEKLKDSGAFYTVFTWMTTNLKLSGNKLAVFAIIYSFSKDGQSEYTGSLTYLQKVVNVKSKTTIITLLNELLEEKYIEKRDYLANGTKIKRTAYRVNMEYFATIEIEDLSKYY